MTDEKRTKMTRREMLKTSLTAGGATLLGFGDLRLPTALGKGARGHALPQGQYLELIEFVGEGLIPMETPMGAGLDGRLYTDLSAVTADHPTTPNEKFYLRTRASELLEDRKPLAIKVTGPLQRPREIGMPALGKMARPAGSHLIG